MPTHVRLVDVAAAAGVSIASASKALNDRSGVSESTRRAVRRAAAELGFNPNALAQSFYRGRSGTVGLVTSDLEGRFVLPILDGAENAFGAGALSVLLCDSRDDSTREQRHIRTLLSRRVDGLIVVGSRTDPRVSLGSALGVPVVYAYAPSEDPGDTSVVTDSAGGGRLAIDHLVSLGRRRIAVIAGDPAFVAARERVAGAVAALSDHALVPVGAVDRFGEWSEAWGVRRTFELLDEHPEVDAIVCGSDQLARGAVSALRESGVRVPEQVAVVGYDNWAVLAMGSRVPITSVDPNLVDLGRVAAEQLSAAIDVVTDPGIVTIPGRLVVRESTAG